MAIKSGVLGSGGAPYFKPADHVNDAVMLIEPRSVRKNVKTSFRDKDGNQLIRDESTVFITAFRNETSLMEGRAYFAQLVTLSNKKLVESAETLLEGGKKDGDDAPAAVVKLVQWSPPTGGNKVWVFRELTTGEIYDATISYYEKREAELAKAIEDAPDFD